MSRAPVTVLFSILLLMSFGLTQNVSADFQTATPQDCDFFSRNAGTQFHEVRVTVSGTSATVRAIDGGLGADPGGGPFPLPATPDIARFVLDGGIQSPVGVTLDSPTGGPFQVTFTALPLGSHTVVVCFIENTLILDQLSHLESVTFDINCSTDAQCSSSGDQCNDGVCNLTTGLCETQPVTDGTACNTGGPFGLPGLCSNGQCVLNLCGNVDCSNLDSQCTVGVCNPADGSCSAQTANEGASCDDDDIHTQNDMCTAGLCDGDVGGIFSCGLGTTPNLITNECEPDVTQAQHDALQSALAEAQAQSDAILTTLFEFLRVFGVI